MFRDDRIRSRDDDGVIWVDPSRIELFCGSKWPHYRKTENILARRLLALNPAFSIYTLGGDWDLEAIPITQTDTYNRMRDLVDHLDDYQNSIWYREFVETLKRDAIVVHKQFRMRRLAEIDDFFQHYAKPLVQSLRDRNYVYREGDELGSVTVDRHGRLQKSGAGRHRFYLSKVLGLKSVPVRVTFVHSDWLKREGLTTRRSDRRALLARIRRIAEGDGAAGED